MAEREGYYAQAAGSPVAQDFCALRKMSCVPPRSRGIALKVKLVSTFWHRLCIDHTVRKFGVSERSACRILGQYRSTQRKVSKGRADDAPLTADIIEFARRNGCTADLGSVPITGFKILG